MKIKVIIYAFSLLTLVPILSLNDQKKRPEITRLDTSKDTLNKIDIRSDWAVLLGAFQRKQEIYFRYKNKINTFGELYNEEMRGFPQTIDSAIPFCGYSILSETGVHRIYMPGFNNSKNNYGIYTYIFENNICSDRFFQVIDSEDFHDDYKLLETFTPPACPLKNPLLNGHFLQQYHDITINMDALTKELQNNHETKKRFHRFFIYNIFNIVLEQMLCCVEDEGKEFTLSARKKYFLNETFYLKRAYKHDKNDIKNMVSLINNHYKVLLKSIELLFFEKLSASQEDTSKD